MAQPNDQNVAQPVFEPNVAPLLIPIQQGEQGVQGDRVADANAMEEVIQNVPDLEEPPQLLEEQLLAMDEDTNTDSDDLQLVQLPILEVEIVPFPDFNNLQPLMPKEFPEEELLGWVNGDGNGNNENADGLEDNDDNGHNEDVEAP